MRYTQQDHPFTSHHSLEKRSVAETLLETINETLAQGVLRPGLSRQAGGRQRRRRQLAGVLAMLTGLVAIGAVFLRPAGEGLPATGEPVAFLELARGRAQMFGSGRDAASSMIMLSGGEPIHAGAVIETGGTSGLATAAGTGQNPADHAAVRLAGGQSMRLDSHSRVIFATDSTVTLERGAIYIDSGGGDHVEVRTALGVVRDIGTRFEVRLVPGPRDVPSLRISVREGSVELERDGEVHLVVAGEELQAHADGRVERGASQICGPRWAWALEATPAPNVAGRPLREFLDWASKEACWTVRFVDQTTTDLAAETILHGDVQDLTLKEAASVILNGSGLAYRLEDGTFTVGPRREG